MVTIRLHEQPMLSQRTDFLCHNCNHWSVYFFSTSPDECAVCNEKLPDLQSIVESKEGRRQFHFDEK